MYEYISIEVPLKRGLKTNSGDTFKDCMDIVTKYAKDGWRLVQIVVPANEKTGVATVFAYQVIFEKQVNA